MPPIVEPGFLQPAYAQYCEVVETLSAAESGAWGGGTISRYINETGREILRRLFQGHLDRRYSEAAYHRPVVGADGEVRPHRRKRTQRQLETLFGEVVTGRVGYSRQQAGVSALYPGDGQLNLPPDKYSDERHRRVAEEASKVSFAETSRTIGETTGAQVGKRQCEAVTVSVAQDFEAFYRQRSGLATAGGEDELLVLSTDGKGIIMHPADLREATAKAAATSSPSKQARLSPGQKRQRKRMATVASVYQVPRYPRRAEDSEVTPGSPRNGLSSATNGSGPVSSRTLRP